VSDTGASRPHAPLFIVGSPRSGTSALADVALAAGYSGFREGMFLSLITQVSAAVNMQFATYATPPSPEVLIGRLDRTAVNRALAETIAGFARSANKVEPWFDKTGNPEMIEAIPMLREIWPDAVFLFAKRRAIENVVSRLRKFPGLGFAYHCRDWARNMAAWRQVAPTLPPAVRREVDQQDMIQQPDIIAAELQVFLGLGVDRRVPMRRAMSDSRPQETSAGTAERRLDLAATGWSPADISTFKTICGPEMQAFGYSMDESYWA